jgi:hypothetical protein
MAGFFSAEDVAKLQQRLTEVQRQCAELKERYIVRMYRSDRAREYASHGFCRRLDTLALAIKLVFEVLPPELEDIPERDAVVAATILIQSFMLNAFGCLDNLAWIWVHEKELKGEDGRELKREAVGLGPRYAYVRNSFSPEFRGYLKSRKRWFKHITDFRDSLAHRIPLYIPPYIVSSHDMDKYNQLEEAAVVAMKGSDHQEYDRLRSEQKKLGRFRPWMTHSQFEKAPTVVFHQQLLQDYVTIDEFGREMLEELERLDKRRMASENEDARGHAAFKPTPLVLTVAAILILLAVLYWWFRH